MHEQTALLIDFLAVIATGWLFGLGARRLGLPLLVGYIAAGAIIGPHALGIVAAGAAVEQFAMLGVVLLLFALGVELSLEELLRVRKVALWGGVAQILLTMAVGYEVGRLLGWADTASFVLGSALALGSTAVLVQLLNERGEVHMQHARVVIGINVTQDLASVVLVGILPVVASAGADAAAPSAFFAQLAAMFGRAGLFVAVMLLLSRTVVPRLLRVVARLGSREIFLTTNLLLCMAGAAAGELLGLSLALGAFLAGMMITESEYHHETFAAVVPLRDIFGLLFFVSLGMLLDPSTIAAQLGDISAIVAALLLGKTLIVLAVVLWAGYHLHTAIRSAFALVQIGEFSFVIIGIALPMGILEQQQYGTIIAAAVISMIMTPVLVSLADPIYEGARHLAPLRRLTRAAREAPELARARRESGHVLVCGYGRVGRIVGETLRQFQVPFVVVDYDQQNVQELRTEGILAVYGDASSPVLLEQIGVDDIRVAVLCLPDSRSTRLTLRHLHRLNPAVRVAVRGSRPEDLLECYEDRADEVVLPEIECGLELVRHTLLRLGHDPRKVEAYVEEFRQERGRCPLPRAAGDWPESG